MARTIPLILLALLAAMHWQLWQGRGSLSNVKQLQAKLEAQTLKNTQAQQVNTRLSAEVRDLQEGLEMVKEKARSELGMVKPNEIFVQIAK
jgi:cell division protein FtsB